MVREDMNLNDAEDGNRQLLVFLGKLLGKSQITEEEEAECLSVKCFDDLG